MVRGRFPMALASILPNDGEYDQPNCPMLDQSDGHNISIAQINKDETGTCQYTEREKLLHLVQEANSSVWESTFVDYSQFNEADLLVHTGLHHPSVAEICLSYGLFHFISPTDRYVSNICIARQDL
ncbi:unnamed protein product [Rotaria magnacalcarata]